MTALVEISAQKELDIYDTLDALCARNRPLEFHYTNLSGEIFVGRSRFLGQDDRHLHLDTPEIVGTKTVLQSGQKIEVFIKIGPETYTFRSRIVKTHCLIKLNHYTTVNGFYITTPRRIWQGQKRHELRLRLKASDQIAVTVHPAAPDQPNAAPLDNTTVNGVIEDFSAGGCGLHLDTARCSDFKFGHPIFLAFTLPEEETELLVQAEVRTVRPPANGYRTRVGIKFRSWPNRAYLTRTLRPLERFIAKVQRDRLKKRQLK